MVSRLKTHLNDLKGKAILFLCLPSNFLEPHPLIKGMRIKVKGVDLQLQLTFEIECMRNQCPANTTPLHSWVYE